MLKLSVQVLEGSKNGGGEKPTERDAYWNGFFEGHNVKVDNLSHWLDTDSVSNTCDLVLVSELTNAPEESAQLFSLLSERFPLAVRVLLSNHVSSMRLNDAGLVHFTLPVTDLSQSIPVLISRVLLLKQLNLDLHLRKRLCQLAYLPVLPEPYLDLMHLLRSREVDVAGVVQAIKRDQILLSKVLHAANATIMGLGHTVTDAHEAVVRLGLDRIYYLVIVVGVFVDIPETAHFQRRRALSKAMDVAFWCAKIGDTLGLSRSTIKKGYLSGLLHNIGDLVLAQAEQDDMDLSAAFDISYGDAAAPGAFWLALWGFDIHVVNAVYHQRDTLVIDFVEHEMASLLMLAKIFEETRRSGGLVERLNEIEFSDPELLEQLLLLK